LEGRDKDWTAGGPKVIVVLTLNGLGSHLLAFLLVHLLELGEVAAVEVQLAVVQVDDVRGHAVEEVTVVRDDNQRLLPPATRTCAHSAEQSKIPNSSSTCHPSRHTTGTKRMFACLSSFASHHALRHISMLVRPVT
jgi:hypothetical protein